MILGIDTSGTQCAVAVVSGARIVRQVRAMERGHAERLMPMIEAALAEAGASFGDLTRIGVCTGPGSFTGIRVGVAAARGLAMGLGVPAIGVGRLEALAAQADAGRPATAVVRGPQGAAYAQDFDADGQPEGPPRMIAADAVPDGWRDAPGACPAVSPDVPQDVQTGAGLAEAAQATLDPAILTRPDLPPSEAARADAARARGRVLVGAGGLLPEALPDPAIIAGLAAGRAAGLPPAPLYLRDSGAAPPREPPPPLLDP